MTEQRQTTGGIGAGVLVVLVIVALAFGIWLGLTYYGRGHESTSIAMDLKAATWLQRPKQLQDFSLIGQDNRPLDRDALKGHWTFLAFGYTNCPDICPTLMATFDAVDKILAKSGAQPRPDFLFISVDPERDTPERIDKYVRYFNPRIRGATAGHDVLRPLTAQLGVLYQRSEKQDTAMGYLVDHSASILLLDPQARLSAIFSVPHDPTAIADDFRIISTHTESKF